MQLIADLQLHSKYSRAVSPQMTIPFIAKWAKKKGIGLVATGDWTHPLWIREIQMNLEEMGNGFLKVKSQKLNVKSTAQNSKLPENNNTENPLFLLATEVSSIYSQSGKVRRVHTLIWVPTIASAEKINATLQRRGCNLTADGRPIIGLSCIHVAELVLSIEPKALLIPAHAWTPHFSVFGSASGFDSIEEAYGPFAKHIYAIETGLSSNPSMNWRIKELDNRSIVSFSDAHSGPKLGREATVFEIPDGRLSYQSMYDAIKISDLQPSSFSLQPSIAYTLEFYPEEGKYHYTGHRNCNIKFSPQETKTKGVFCPVCRKRLTEGVMQRVEQLAGRSEESVQLDYGLRTTDYSISSEIHMIGSNTFPHRPPFVMLVQLQEIIAEALSVSTGSQKVQRTYDTLVDELGGEFQILLQTPAEDIARVGGAKIAEGVQRVRAGNIVIDPGYDGVFGKVEIWKKENKASVDNQMGKDQLSLF